MSSFISALMKQRKDAKKAEPDTSGRLMETFEAVGFDEILDIE